MGAAPTIAPAPVGFSATADAPRRSWVQQIMGMPVSVHLRGDTVRTIDVEHHVRDYFDELRRVDRIFSTYRSESQISRLNRGEITLDDCSPTVAEVMRLCADAHIRTGGLFDAQLPRLDGAGRWFDPSGLVKTWAVQRAAMHLTHLAGVDMCLNTGGDVMVSTVEGRSPWRVGVEDPAATGRLLDVLTLADGAVATSGGAHRGAHIVDPRTGRPAEQVRALTVTGPSLMWADIYATAGVVHGREAIGWLEAIAGFEALLVDDRGEVLTTSGWAAV